MKLSVIIPALDEEKVISETLKTVQSYGKDAVCEILVVDGGSADNTVSVARSHGAKAIVSPRRGRAAQMNYGAEKARGELLYFLHADSIPPPHFAEQIQISVSEGYEAGCFRLTFDEDHPLLNLYAWFTRFDVDAFRYGDQSLFVLRDVFSAIDGFREDHIVMEDNEIIRRIKSEYSFSILDDAVETSARSYREVGIVKLQMIFVLIYTLYFLGVEQENLAHIRKEAIS